MRNKKRCLAQFTFFDRTGIQAYLEKMAEKGWMLEKMAMFYWQFTRIEPKKIHFAVTYFPKSSEFDPEPGEEQRMFFAFCERAGWKFIDSTAQIQVFYNEEEDPVAIETDAEVELENIHKSAKKNFLIGQTALLVCALLQLGIAAADFRRDSLYVLGSNAKLYGIVCWSIVMIMCLTEVIGYFLWYRKAKKAAETDGSFVKTRGSRKFQFILLTVVMVLFVVYIGSLRDGIYRLSAFAGIVWMLLLLLLVNLVKNLLKRMKVSTGVTRAVTITSSFLLSFSLMGVTVAVVFKASDAGWFEKEPVATYEHNGWIRNIYHDELPLTIEELMETDYKDYSYELDVEESVFLKKSEAWQRAKINDTEPEMRYDIYEVKLPVLYDFCLETIMDGFVKSDRDGTLGYYFQECEASDWAAEKVYQYYSGEIPMTRYLICYDSHIVRLTFYWEPTQEQMQAAGEKLKNR